jgi:hypothetical protein
MIVRNLLELDIADRSDQTIEVGVYKGYGQHWMDKDYGDMNTDDAKIILDERGRGIFEIKQIHHITFWLLPPLGVRVKVEKPAFEISLSDNCRVVPYRYGEEEFGLYRMNGKKSIKLIPRELYEGAFEKDDKENRWKVYLKIRKTADLCTIQ